MSNVPYGFGEHDGGMPPIDDEVATLRQQLEEARDTIEALEAAGQDEARTSAMLLRELEDARRCQHPGPGFPQCGLPAVLCETHGGHDACAVDDMNLRRQLAALTAERDALRESALMVAADGPFFFGGDHPMLTDGKKPRELHLYVLCSDLFGYACADAETVPWELMAEAWAAHMACQKHGTELWVQRRRGGPEKAPFIKPVADEVAACETCRKALGEAG